MIRMATSDDCRDLAALHILTWQQAYAGLMPAEFLRQLDLELETRSEQWKQGISENAVSVMLDYDDDTLAGFAALGKCHDSDADSNWGELGALYYQESFWGTGRAEPLLHRALGHLEATGHAVTTLWVLEGNRRAIAFYQKHGFSFDGQEKVEQQPGFTLRELRMRKRLLA